ncbi:MAG: NADPH-dependent FMN reductase, partial [Nitrosomonas sp.]
MEKQKANNINPTNQAGESTVIEIRKGQTSGRLDRAEFSVRFRATFIDPSFRNEDESIARLEEIAWQAYMDGRKAPFTQQAGSGYVDPDYKLSVEWMNTKQRIEEAKRLWNEPSTPSRVLVICGSARNDGTCPGEMSKSFRLAEIVRETLKQTDIQVDLLDLSLITSEYGR